MSEQAYSVEAIARQIIERCRADIDAALSHLEAARHILERSFPLLERWRRSAHESNIRLPAFDYMKAGMFELVEPRPRRDRLKDMHAAVRKALSDRRSRRQSASG